MRDGENEQDVVPAFMELTIWRGNKHRHMLIEQCSQYNDRDVHWVYHRQASSSGAGHWENQKGIPGRGDTGAECQSRCYLDEKAKEEKLLLRGEHEQKDGGKQHGLYGGLQKYSIENVKSKVGGKRFKVGVLGREKVKEGFGFLEVFDSCSVDQSYTEQYSEKCLYTARW